MTRTEIFLRLGWYCGYIGKELGDHSFADRTLGRAHLMSHDEAIAMMQEIQHRLVLHNVIKPDEDPFTKSGITMREIET